VVATGYVAGIGIGSRTIELAAVRGAEGVYTGAFTTDNPVDPELDTHGGRFPHSRFDRT